MKFPNKKYQIIYADPPWRYKDKGAPYGTKDRYDVLNIENIKNIPVQKIADIDCILFLWAVYPLIQEALDVIQSWGFIYKTLGFQWVKMNDKKKTPFLGVGNWTRSNSEPCLIGVKGKPKRKKMGVPQVVMTPIGKHSEKPPIVKQRIVRLMGNLPRIELFYRYKPGDIFVNRGWDFWGDEAEKPKEVKPPKQGLLVQ